MFMQSKQNIQLNQKAIQTKFENYSNGSCFIQVSQVTTEGKSFPKQNKKHLTLNLFGLELQSSTCFLTSIREKSLLQCMHFTVGPHSSCVKEYK